MKKLLGGKAWLKILSDKDKRREFVRDHVVTHLAFQIRTMRQNKNMSQNDLAKKAGSTQAAISRLEDESNESITLKTLFKIADAFDCAIQISLVPFSKVLRTMAETQPDKLIATSYVEDRVNIEKVCDGSYEDEKAARVIMVPEEVYSKFSPPQKHEIYIPHYIVGEAQISSSDIFMETVKNG